MNSILLLIIDFWYKFLLHLHQKPEPFPQAKKKRLILSVTVYWTPAKCEIRFSIVASSSLDGLETGGSPSNWLFKTKLWIQSKEA